MYTNWDKNQDLILNSKWYNAHTVVDTLHDIKQSIILNTFERNLPCTISIPLPVTKEKRFPLHEFYIYEATNDSCLKLTTINSLIQKTNIKDGYIEIRVLFLINQLLKNIESHTVNRQQFESRFKLYWKNECDLSHNLGACENIFCVAFKKLLFVINQFKIKFAVIE